MNEHGQAGKDDGVWGRTSIEVDSGDADLFESVSGVFVVSVDAVVDSAGSGKGASVFNESGA